MNSRALAAAVSATILFAGCGAKKEEAPAPAAAPAVDLAAEEAAIRNRSAEWMNYANAKDAASIAKVFAPDAITIFDGNVRRGSAEIMAGVEKGFAENPNSVVSWTTDSVKMAQSGDLAVEYGTVHVDEDGADGKKPATDGAFTTVWEKVDGAWRVASDAGTDNAKKPEEAKPAN